MYQILNNLATCSFFESCTPAGWIIVDVRDLRDNSNNSIEFVLDKIQLIGNLLCGGYKVVVRCQAGISRSNAIACAAMTWIAVETYWDDNWKLVEKACPRARLNLEFLDVVREALIKLGVERKRL